MMDPDEFGDYIADLERRLEASKAARVKELYNQLVNESDETYREQELAGNRAARSRRPG